MRRAFILSACAGLLAAAPAARAAPVNYAAAIAAPDRPEADRQRDAERKPAAMLAFAGVKPGDTVVDFLPGGGYFTRLFSTAVGPQGHVVAYVPGEIAGRMAKMVDGMRALAAEPGRGNISVSTDPLAQAPAPGSADIVWTSQNYHDLHNGPSPMFADFNRRVFAMLKPGGTYVVLDHTAAPGSGVSATGTLHRIDPAAVRQEVEAAGFRFAGETRVLANRADDHTLKVFDPSLRGRTDQFVYRFRKPK